MSRGPKKDDKSIVDNIDLNHWQEIIGWEKDGIHDSRPRAAVYGRYSSDDQNPGACQGRVEQMLDKAVEDDVVLYVPPIIDEALTGRDEEREGIKKLWRIAPNIEYVYVYSLDRWARNLPFGMYFLDKLNREYDIKLVTHSKDFDLRRTEDLIVANAESMVSDAGNRNRAHATLHGKLTKFKEGNWYAINKKIPLGYSEADDLLEVNEEQVPWLKRMIEEFLRWDVKDGYMISYLDESYEGYFDRCIQKADIKKRLLKPVYIGKPTAQGQSIGDSGQKVVLDRPDLQILTEDEQERLRFKVEKIREHFSRDKTTKRWNVNTLQDEFGFLPVFEQSFGLKITCPECDTILRTNGSRPIAGGEEEATMYECPRCKSDDDVDAHYRQYPRSDELTNIRLAAYVMENHRELRDIIDFDKI